MSIHTFNKLTVYGRVPLKCERCGKRRVRTKVFWKTQNPFNQNADGTIRTGQEILAALTQERIKWAKDLKLCATCEASS